MASKRVLVVTVDLQDGELTRPEKLTLLRQIYTLPIGQELAVSRGEILARVASYIDDAIKASGPQHLLHEQPARQAAQPFDSWVAERELKRQSLLKGATARATDSFVHWPR